MLLMDRRNCVGRSDLNRARGHLASYGGQDGYLVAGLHSRLGRQEGAVGNVRHNEGPLGWTAIQLTEARLRERPDYASLATPAAPLRVGYELRQSSGCFAVRF